MVGIVVVSHSDALAQGVVALARQMSPPELRLEAAGGIGEEGVLGTSAELVSGAIERAMSPDGVLVLMDLGSALMSAEFALELLEGAAGQVRLSDAPLVEGTVAAAAAAGGGASLEEVAAEARRALAMKTSQFGSAETEPTAPPPAPAPDAEAELLVGNEVGLHARPAARFVETARAFDAEVLVAKTGADGSPVSARSLTNVVALGARRGETVRVLASGPQAREAVAALRELAATGFGDGLPAPTAGTVLSGIAASGGVAVAPARVLQASTASPTTRVAGSAEQELALFQRGLTATRAALADDREHLRTTAGGEEAAIFDAHLALLDDEALLEPARNAIAAGAVAERAIADAAEQVAAIYRDLDNPLLAERAVDVLDVGGRVAAAISAESRRKPSAPPSGQPTSSANGDDNASHSQILVTDELLPSQTARLDPEQVAGIATARGSATAHAAIIARSLGIPAVLGLGQAILAVPDGTRLLIDGDSGCVTVAPPEDQVAESEARGEQARTVAAQARALAGEPAVLASGERVEVFANIGSVADARRAVELGAEGVGLLRTEFLFLERTALPEEREQADVLREIAAALEGRPLVVRTLDAGADKPLPSLPMPAEANPFLGVRGIRLGLRNPEMLAIQLRAVLRVAAEHPLKLMLPMVSSLAEIAAVRELLEQARAATGVDAELDLGIMVEVPAAALVADQLAPHVAFFSLGTNDLTQYTMAAERGNAELEPLLAGPQPPVLRLVQATVQAARAHGRWVGVCGELGGDPATAVLLVGLGVSELSMAPTLIPAVKQALRRVDLESARTAAEHALRAESAEAARAYALELLGAGR